jgi:3-(3-hydroxy-phenyl)propionate hydroxylase
VPHTPRQAQLPRLEDGLLAARDDATHARGTLFPQPRLDGGALMDHECGTGWRLVLDASQVSPDGGFGPAAVGVTVVALGRDGTREAEGVVAAWMRRHRCVAALIRPDHYVFGTAPDGPAIGALLAERRAALGL